MNGGPCKISFYQNCDYSFHKPDGHVVAGGDNISSFSVKLGILRNSGFVISSEFKYLDVDIGDNEDIAVVEKNQIKPNRVPNCKVVEMTSFRLFKEEWDAVEELFNPSHAASIALGFGEVEQPEKGGHGRGSN